jgi:HK97 family phage major capsid protein
MSEQIQTREAWESLDVKGLASVVAEKEQEQIAFYKANKDRFDDDRFAIYKQRNETLKSMKDALTKKNEIEAIYRDTVESRKAMNEPADHVPFENNGGDTNITQTTGSIKSLGEALATNQAVKSIGHWEDIRQPFSLSLSDVFPSFDNTSVKTVMTRAAGYAPANDRTSKLVSYPQREPRLADLIPVTQTNLGTINYMEETTALAGTNAQVSIAEGNLKFENALAFTARSVPVETVGTWLPVTTQQLDDVAGIQGIIENRMSLFLQLKEEDLLLNGTGTTPQMIGFQGAGAPNVLTQARGTDTNIDAIFKAIQQIRVTGLAEPDGVVMHPDNFTMIATYKATTGEYGFDVTVDNAGVTRLWGKPLILSPVATVGTALVGAFGAFSEIWRRMGMTVMVGLNSDDFTKNKRTVLAEFREALTIYRQTAFAEVTGLQ